MRVVTLVAGDITNDTRVKRQAIGLARAGLDVTVVSRALGQAGDVRPLGPALVLKVPVPGDVRHAVLARRARRRAWRPLPAAVADAEARALTERRRAARALAGPAGRTPAPVARLRDAVARRAVPRLDALARRVDEGMASLWERFDEHFYGSSFGASWRSTLDGLVDDLELGYGPVVDALRPDVVHAHDMHVLGVAVHAARRAAADGRRVRVVYDAHEYVPGLAVAGAFTRRSIAAWADYEAHYVHDADAVIAVSEASAQAIQERHRLPRRPTVVLNVPVTDESEPPPVTLRAACGLPEDVPLLVYAGIIREVRGIDTSIAALHHLPGVHLAVVCVPHSRTRPVLRLQEEVRRQGLGHRVHFVDPVRPGQVVPFVASADIGLVPMVGGWLNHELTLPNKLFEYVAAGVPVVASDLRSLGAVVREHGIGETFPPGDAAGLARAAAAVLANPGRYRSRVRAPEVQEPFSWPAQERALHGVYRTLLGDLPAPPARQRMSLAELPVRRERTGLGRSAHLVLGPANRGGRCTALADAVRDRLPGVTVTTSMVGRRRSDPPVDRPVARETYRRDLVWQAEELRWLFERATHVLLEDGYPLAGTVHGEDGVEQARLLTAAGIRVGVWLDPPTAADLSRVQAWAELGAVICVTDRETAAAVDGAAWLPEPGGVDAGHGGADEAVRALASALGLPQAGRAERTDGR